MSRIGRGWALVKQSFTVLRADRSLMLLPVISGAASVAVAAIPFALWWSAER